MKTIFTFPLCLFFGHLLFSQPILQWSPKLCSQEKATMRFNFYGMPVCDPNQWLLPAHFPTDFPVNVSSIPQVYRRHEQPVFCQFEWTVERKIKVPVRFRLGEVEYVDKLEGKSSYDRWMRTIGSAMNLFVEKRGVNPIWD